MNRLDHSGHSRGFHRSWSTSAFVGTHCFIVVDLLGGKRPGLQHLRNGLLNCYIARSVSTCSPQGLLRSGLLIGLVLEVYRSYWPSLRNLLSLGSSWRVICFEHQLIGNKHHYSLMLFSSVCALAHALPLVVDAWFPVPSFAFPALASSARTVPILVASWFRIQHQIFSSFPRAFALLKMFPKHFPSLGHLLLLHFALFEQLGCPLCNFYCSGCRSQLQLRWFALDSLLVACPCLYMQANDSPNLLCTFVLLSDVLQQN